MSPVIYPQEIIQSSHFYICMYLFSLVFTSNCLMTLINPWSSKIAAHCFMAPHSFICVFQLPLRHQQSCSRVLLYNLSRSLNIKAYVYRLVIQFHDAIFKFFSTIINHCESLSRSFFYDDLV